MKPPTLNLRQHHCERFEITTTFQLEASIHSDLVQSLLVADQFKKPGAVYLKSYKLKGSGQGCIYHGFADPSNTTKGVVQYECHMEYRPGTPHMAWESLTTKQFDQMTDVFQNSAIDLKSAVQALFQFPLESFEPKLQLPLTLQEDVDGKTVHMSGCELQIQSGAQRYNQYLGVRESHVISGITSLRIEEPFTSDSIRAKFRECINISKDMVKRIKGGPKR